MLLAAQKSKLSNKNNLFSDFIGDDNFDFKSKIESHQPICEFVNCSFEFVNGNEIVN